MGKLRLGNSDLSCIIRHFLQKQVSDLVLYIQSPSLHPFIVQAQVGALTLTCCWVGVDLKTRVKDGWIMRRAKIGRKMVAFLFFSCFGL